MPYSRDLLYALMQPTAGQLLTQELKDRKIKKSAFARRVGKIYQTVNYWTKDQGFGPDQRSLAARALGLPTDHFDRPDLATIREQYRQRVLEEFRRGIGERINVDLEEYTTIESIRFGSHVVPTVEFYWGVVLLLRKEITPSQFKANMREVAKGAAENRELQKRTVAQAKRPKSSHK